MLKIKFGIEVEFTGITRTKASRIIEKHFGGRLTKLGGSYDNRKYTKLEKMLHGRNLTLNRGPYKRAGKR